MRSIRENLVLEYLSNVNFRQEDWSLSKIKADMKRFLGEEPAIDIAWEKDVVINEGSNESKEIEKVGSVKVIFTDDNDKFKKIEIKI
jgi:hypothetical protein